MAFACGAGKEAIEFSMGRGWWDAAAKVLLAADASGVDLSTTVHQTASRIQSKIQYMKDIVHKTHGSV